MDELSPFGPGNPERPTAVYIFLRFLRYGWLAWGGPVAQIALMHRELVDRDRWIGEDRFRKVLALYQALPGPEAHELAVYFGMLKRGRVGGFLAGLGFMLPGVLLVTALAALYVRFSATTDLANLLLFGVRPAVVALIAVAFWRLLKATVTGPEHVALAVGAALAPALLPQTNFLILLLAGGLLALLTAFATGQARPPRNLPILVPFLLATFPALSTSGLAALAVISAKAGLLTFGGAYTAIPFLHDGAVLEQAWITEAQFLDALAISGMVPGPLIAVGTFIGYQAAGLAGAVVATLLIFAPAFAFTLLGHRFFEPVVFEPRLHAFLLGVTATVIGLIAATVLEVSETVVESPAGLALAALAGLAFATRRVPIPVVILASAAAGILAQRWA